MTYQELFISLGLHNKDIIATIIKPVRKDDCYKQGRVIGFKPGLYGGGFSDYRKDKQQKDGRGAAMPHSFNSFNMHWIKKPRVLIEYPCFTFGKSTHWDWIDVDNCTFEFKEYTE